MLDSGHVEHRFAVRSGHIEGRDKAIESIEDNAFLEMSQRGARGFQRNYPAPEGGSKSEKYPTLAPASTNTCCFPRLALAWQ